MTVEPISGGSAVLAAQERNLVRVSLRTSGFTTHEGQRQWFEGINRPESDIWYWQFVDNDVTRGVGGLVNIDRVNLSAEISILVFAHHRGKGHGRGIVRWLLTEAFDHMNMHKVWAEVYDCNPAKDAWPKLLEGYEYVTSHRPDTKYWNGQYHGSTFYDIARS